VIIGHVTFRFKFRIMFSCFLNEFDMDFGCDMIAWNCDLCGRLNLKRITNNAFEVQSLSSNSTSIVVWSGPNNSTSILIIAAWKERGTQKDRRTFNESFKILTNLIDAEASTRGIRGVRNHLTFPGFSDLIFKFI
jgi:hypothetical protein